MPTPRPFVLLLLAATLSLTACEISDPLDGVDLKLRIENEPIGLGDGIEVAVRPGEATVSTATLPSDLDVASVDDIASLSLSPSGFTFTPGSGKNAARASGTITGFVAIGGFPLPGTPIVITVTDNVVTAVSPETLLADGQQIDLSAYEAYLDLLPASQRPDLRDVSNLSIDEIKAGIAEALSGSSIPIVWGVTAESTDPNDPLTGSIRLSEISLSGDITAD